MIEQSKDFQDKLAAQTSEFNNNLIKILPLLTGNSEIIRNKEQNNDNGKNKENHN